MIVKYLKRKKAIQKPAEYANITLITILELIKVIKLTLYYHLIIIAFLSACEVSSQIFKTYEMMREKLSESSLLPYAIYYLDIYHRNMQLPFLTK